MKVKKVSYFKLTLVIIINLFFLVIGFSDVIKAQNGCDIDLDCKLKFDNKDCTKKSFFPYPKEYIDENCEAAKNALNEHYRKEYENCKIKEASLIEKCKNEKAFEKLQKENSQGVALLKNGEECAKSFDCISGYCYPGPPDNEKKYCLDENLNCANANSDGAVYGDIVEVERKYYRCIRPPEGPARWRLQKICSSNNKIYGSYEIMVENLVKQRNAIVERYKNVNSENEKLKIINEAIDYIQGSISCAIIPYWYGTPYSYEGTIRSPDEGSIGSAYLVLNFLLDSGFSLERNKLARLPSEKIILNITSNSYVKRFSNVKINEFLDAVINWGEGIYIVGLDRTIGLIIFDGEEVYFVQSSYIEPRIVLKENAVQSLILSSSKYKVLSKIFSDKDLILKWLKNERIKSR